MPFREINSKMVEAQVQPGQRMFSQRGAMLAYTRRGRASPPTSQGGQGGLMSMIGRRVANEATPLMTVEGNGTVMFGHGGHHVQVIDLDGRHPLRRGRPAARLRRRRWSRARSSSARTAA